MHQLERETPTEAITLASRKVMPFGPFSSAHARPGGGNSHTYGRAEGAQEMGPGEFGKFFLEEPYEPNHASFPTRILQGERTMWMLRSPDSNLVLLLLSGTAEPALETNEALRLAETWRTNEEKRKRFRPCDSDFRTWLEVRAGDEMDTGRDICPHARSVRC